MSLTSAPPSGSTATVRSAHRAGPPWWSNTAARRDLCDALSDCPSTLAAVRAVLSPQKAKEGEGMTTLHLFEPEHESPHDWRITSKGSRALIDLADRHYTRQSPGSNLCCRPGHNLTMITNDGRAAWIVWRPVPEVGRMDNLEAWELTMFRNEGAALSSALILSATAITYSKWGWPPPDGLITAVGIAETRRRRSATALPGHCFRTAGWTEFKRSADGRLCWLRAPRPMRLARC